MKVQLNHDFITIIINVFQVETCTYKLLIYIYVVDQPLYVCHIVINNIKSSGLASIFFITVTKWTKAPNFV